MDNWQPNNNWLVDDKTGTKIRAQDARKEWNGLITHRDRWEPRHPQDSVRARPDHQNVDNPRPRPVDTYIGPLTTLIAAAHSAGATSITIESSVRMEIGDRITILLDNGEPHRTTILSVTDAATIVIAAALPWAASSGNFVADNTATAPSDVA